MIAATGNEVTLAAALNSPARAVVGHDPLAARLGVLLPALDNRLREQVLQVLVDHVRLLVLQSWGDLVERCAGGLSPATAAALLSIASQVPEPDLLLARLDRLVTPPVLLALPFPHHAALTAALLAHPNVQLREHALDALMKPDRIDLAAPEGARGSPVDRPGPQGGYDRADAALVGACAAWSRRMLIAELGHIPALCHTDRLRLQDELLAGSIDAPRDEAEFRTLGAALHAAANRRATAILAERAGVSSDVAEVAIALRDPKMLLALCWNAGCDAAEVVAVQVQLGRIPPGQVLRVGAGDCWPLDPVAMQWQIAVLQDI